MTNWKNLDTLDSYKALKACKGSVDLTTVMAGESGADRAKNYSVPMAEKLTYNFAAKEVDDTVLEKLAALLLMKGYNAPAGIHPDAPQIFTCNRFFHRKAPFTQHWLVPY